VWRCTACRVDYTLEKLAALLDEELEEQLGGIRVDRL
jgi:hypothetical protein